MDGIDVVHGLSTSSTHEADLNQRMIAAAQEVIVVTDSSKFGVRGFSKICTISQIDKFVTDSQAPLETVSRLEESGIDVLLD